MKAMCATAPTLPGAGTITSRRETHPCRDQKESAVSMKDEYFAMMTSQFRRWDARFGLLTDEAGPTIAAADVRYDARIKTMRANRDVAYRKLQEIRTANESAWRSMQAGVDEAWTSLKNALDKALAETGGHR